MIPKITFMHKSEVGSGQQPTSMLHLMQCQAMTGVDCQKSSVLHMA